MLPTLQDAIKAIKAGDKAAGRQMLADIIQADLENELAWLWLAGIANSDAERQKYLKQVLTINPDNEAARRGLAELAEKLGQGQGPAEAQSPHRSLSERLAAKESRPEALNPLPKSGPEAAEPEPEAPAAESAEAVPSPPAEAADETPAEEEVAAAEAEPSEAETVEAQEPVSAEAEVEADAGSSPEEAEAPPEQKQADSQPAPPAETPPTDPVALALYRLAQYWQTDRGLVIVGGGAVALLLSCAACFVFGIVFQPMLTEVPPTLAAVIGTPTPTLTFTPIPSDTPTPTPSPTETATPTATPTQTPTATGTPVVADTPTVTVTPSRTPTRDLNFEQAEVIRAVAGDLVEILLEGELRQVKYILIDAPDLGLPESDAEPLAGEALALNRSLVEGQIVTLEKDRRLTDEAGRLLRYVYVGELMVNEELLRQGLARVELIPPNLKYGARLQEAERSAQAGRLGIWGLE